MSVKICCCLCCTPGIKKYKYLQNDVGECNEFYEITVKYFDPMLLTEHINTICAKESSVLCENCWVHIQDFHEFQQAVMKTRTSLEQINIQESSLHIKVEETVMKTRTSLEQINIEESSLHIKVEEDQGTTVLNDYKDVGSKKSVHLNEVLIKSDLENKNHLKEDVVMYSEDDEDDEKPLTKLKNTQMSLKFNKQSDNKIHNKETGNFDEKIKPQSRKLRKSKSYIKLSKNLGYDDGDDDEVFKGTKTNCKDSGKESGFHPTLEKGREYDKFIEEWKSQLECDICSETFPIFEMLKVHFKEKHNCKGYVKCCDRKFDRRCSLVEHIRLHINPETYKCDICGKPSSTKFNLKLHKKVVHEETDPFECEVCHRSFNQKPNLERHLLTHVTGSKDFVCEECGKGYVLECQLKSHIKTVHSDNRVCDQCGKTLHGIGALKKHLMEHAGIEKPKYTCDECGAQLGTRGSLRRHKAAYHNDGSTIYVCSICGKVAASKYGLLTHKKNVHEERKHKCSYCDKAFKRPQFLREHIATHTGEDLYQCPHCPQTFKVSSNMHHHRKKAHPIEFEEGRKNRLQLRKVDITQVTNQVVL